MGALNVYVDWLMAASRLTNALCLAQSAQELKEDLTVYLELLSQFTKTLSRSWAVVASWSLRPTTWKLVTWEISVDLWISQILCDLQRLLRDLFLALFFIRHLLGLSTEFPQNFRHPCTTMPWTIWPALVVLWGVCWMFYPNQNTCTSHTWYDDDLTYEQTAEQLTQPLIPDSSWLTRYCTLQELEISALNSSTFILGDSWSTVDESVTEDLRLPSTADALPDRAVIGSPVSGFESDIYQGSSLNFLGATKSANPLLTSGLEDPEMSQYLSTPSHVPGRLENQDFDQHRSLDIAYKAKQQHSAPPEARINDEHGRTTVTEGGRHICLECGEALGRKSDLDRHMATHREGTYFCTYPNCSRKKPFDRRDNRDRHMRMVHKKDLIENRFEAQTVPASNDFGNFDYPTASSQKRKRCSEDLPSDDQMSNSDLRKKCKRLEDQVAWLQQEAAQREREMDRLKIENETYAGLIERRMGRENN